MRNRPQRIEGIDWAATGRSAARQASIRDPERCAALGRELWRELKRAGPGALGKLMQGIVEGCAAVAARAASRELERIRAAAPPPAPRDPAVIDVPLDGNGRPICRNCGCLL